MKNLWQFDSLRTYLESLGVRIGADSDFELVRVDFNRALRDGRVEFADGRIFIEIDGVKFPGYVYMRDYNIDRFGYPKMHITECSTIREFKERKLYSEKYWWSAESTVPVINRLTNETHENVSLKLCRNCLSELGGNDAKPRTSEEFYELYQDEIKKARKKWSDLNGYSGGFWHVSRAIRQEVGKCEHCGLEIKQDYQNFHVHHKDGNKDNNVRSNLQCLCMLCHYGVDDHHRMRLLEDKLKKAAMRRFLSRRLEDLKNCNNPYLSEEPIKKLLEEL